MPNTRIKKNLSVKRLVDLEALPSECDFWIYGKNKLAFSSSSHFKKDIQNLNDTYFKNDSSALVEVSQTNCSNWVRDAVSTKNANSMYKSMTFKTESFRNDIIRQNKNVASSIQSNISSDTVIRGINANTLPTRINLLGGNSFNCVNAKGKHWVIVGELGVTPEDYYSADAEEINELNKLYPNTGSQSHEKYPNFFEEKNQAIQYRKLHKQVIKSQISPDASVVVIPNAWAYHIDIEIAVLPNGIVLIHSFEKTLELLEKHKEEITQKWNYEELIETTRALSNQYQHLFSETKRKLEKRDFIVKEVCGFITTKNEIDGIIATGFNGLPCVLETGEIMYTLPPNEPWFSNYFSEELEKCGVSNIYFLKDQPLSFMAKQGGFFRCQTQNIPNEAFLSDTQNPKMR